MTKPYFSLDMIRAALTLIYTRLVESNDEPTDDVSNDVTRVMTHNIVEIDVIMPIDHAFALSISFYDECEMRAIAFYDYDHQLTHVMISSDDTPYNLLTVD